MEDVGLTANADDIVDKLTGNNSGSQKEEGMAAFMDRFASTVQLMTQVVLSLQVLLCTDVAAMGCHVDNLNCGIGLGTSTPSVATV